MKHAGSKTHRSIELKLFAIVVLMLLTGFGCQTGPSGQASLDSTVVRLKGAARFSENLKSWHSAKVGDVLPSGCIIQTAADSRIDIELGQIPSTHNLSATTRNRANLVRLLENSILKIEQHTDKTFAETTKLAIRAGWMAGYVISPTEHASFEIAVSNSVFRVRDGTFQLSASREVHVLKGAVTIETSEPSSTMEITAGHWYDPATASIQIEPERIRCPPDNSDPTNEKFEAVSEFLMRKRALIWGASPTRRN